MTIRNVDHGPPHCHAWLDGHDAQIDLVSLAVQHPPPHKVPANLRKGLLEVQDDMIRAWDRVKVIPPGSSPGVW